MDLVKSVIHFTCMFLWYRNCSLQNAWRRHNFSSWYNV